MINFAKRQIAAIGALGHSMLIFSHSQVGEGCGDCKASILNASLPG